MPSEAQARITINRLLEQAGWRLLPDAAGSPANVICEHRISGRRVARQDDLGSDFERAPSGSVDYVLRGRDGRAVALVEAKRESLDPLTGHGLARHPGKKRLLLFGPFANSAGLEGDLGDNVPQDPTEHVRSAAPIRDFGKAA
jgi:type I site-specific restriction endonuclease